MPTFPVIPSIFFPAVGVFWIFLIWVLWMIVKSLRGLDKSLEGANALLKEIAQGLNKQG